MQIVSPHEATRQALSLLVEYAERTGLLTSRPARRYLPCDAHAVSGLLELTRRTRDRDLLVLAEQLVAQVHAVLGSYRADDERSGPLSGLPPSGLQTHPTRAGLRSGEGLSERAADAPFDAGLEWERDGQHFCHLMRWARALLKIAGFSNDMRYLQWAQELVLAAHRSFVYRDAEENRLRMYWKMSTDLSRPLVAAMGRHDAVNGWLTCLELRHARACLGQASSPRLEAAQYDFQLMLQRTPLRTAEPLQLGELLVDACRLAQLHQLGIVHDVPLLGTMLNEALEGLSIYTRTSAYLSEDPARDAHLELALSVGLSAVSWLHADPERMPNVPSLHRSLAKLQRYVAVGYELRSHWLAPEQRRTLTWSAHRDLSEVMLAISLIPEAAITVASLERSNTLGPAATAAGSALAHP